MMGERPLPYGGATFHVADALDAIRRQWPVARLESHAVGAGKDLTSDVLWAEPQQPEQWLVLTSGLHGIEGGLGAVMLDLFMREFAPRLDPRTTGIVLVHPVNPWGMRFGRRTNARGVDLNRNFVWDSTGSTPSDRLYDRHSNPEYEGLGLLNPRQPVHSLGRSTLEFGAGLVMGLMRIGPRRLSRATLLGQYADPQGVYFGGHQRQEETKRLAELFERALARSNRVVLLDMHSGYGPRFQMSVVASPLAAEPAAETARRIRYPRVVKATGEEFYAISGDMIDYIYKLREAHYPDRHLFAAAFEFGTFGESFSALLRSLRITILENQAYLNGASDPAGRWIEREWRELYYPSEARWWGSARADARHAFEGILRAEGMLA